MAHSLAYTVYSKKERKKDILDYSYMNTWVIRAEYDTLLMINPHCDRELRNGAYLHHVVNGFWGHSVNSSPTGDHNTGGLECLKFVHDFLARINPTMQLGRLRATLRESCNSYSPPSSLGSVDLLVLMIEK